LQLGRREFEGNILACFVVLRETEKAESPQTLVDAGNTREFIKMPGKGHRINSIGTAENMLLVVLRD